LLELEEVLPPPPGCSKNQSILSSERVQVTGTATESKFLKLSEQNRSYRTVLGGSKN
jgi:hypothetical protein